MSAFPAAAARVVDAFSPSLTLTLRFGGAEAPVVAEGSTQTPTVCAAAPAVMLAAAAAAGAPAAAAGLYTLILSDPDAPSVADPKFGEWQHWVLVNAAVAADGALHGGEARTAYFGSAPGKDSGAHRYCLVAYAQPRGERIELSDELDPPVSATSGFPPRRSFNSRTFAARHGLTPVAALTYLAEWDEAVPELAKRLAPPQEPAPAAAAP